MYCQSKKYIYICIVKQLKTITMRTVAEIKAGITRESVVAIRPSMWFDEDSYEMNVECNLFSQLAGFFNTKSESNNFYVKGRGMQNVKTFDSEEVLETLRTVYKSTANKFVRSVIATVGKERKYSDKQLEVIVDEIMKMPNFLINL